MKQFFCLIIFASMFITVASAQTIKGQIKNADGEPATGASVLLKNTFKNVTADKFGNFQLDVQKPGNYTLVISSVGYKNVEQLVSVPDTNAVFIKTIILDKSISSLKEVTVTASRKAEIVDRTPASVQVINAREIQAQTAISPNL